MVVFVDASVVHQLDAAWQNHRSALRARIHHGHLPLVVSDGNRAANGVVVRCDVLIGSQIQVPGRSVIENSFLHGKTVSIGVEHSRVVDLRRQEVDGDFMSDQRIVGDSVELDIESQNREVFNRDPNYCVSCRSFLVSLKSQYKLRLQDSSRHADALKRSVRVRVILAIFRSKDIDAAVLLVVALETLPVPQVESYCLSHA